MKKLSKNTVLLCAAVGLGIACFVGANYYLRTYLAQAESRLAGAYQAKKVIVASIAIPAGGVLSSDNLAVRSIPARYLASTVIEPDALDMVSGQKIMVALQPGDPIDRGALERGDRAALSTTVAKGERAITFPVDEISSISGMLVPGDIIDLLYTGPGTTANSYQPLALAVGTGAPKDLLHVRMILQSVTVMATGKTTQRRVVRTESGGQQEVNMDFTTVTLKVSLAQAQQVLIGQKLGQLTAVLRNPDDSAKVDKLVLDEVTFKQVEAGPKGGAVGDYIDMIIGGSGAVGGVRAQAEVGRTLAAPPAPPAAPAPPPKPVPSAADVKNRLGLNPAPAVPPVALSIKP